MSVCFISDSKSFCIKHCVHVLVSPEARNLVFKRKFYWGLTASQPFPTRHLPGSCSLLPSPNSLTLPPTMLRSIVGLLIQLPLKQLKHFNRAVTSHYITQIEQSELTYTPSGQTSKDLLELCGSYCLDRHWLKGVMFDQTKKNC